MAAGLVKSEARKRSEGREPIAKLPRPSTFQGPFPLTPALSLREREKTVYLFSAMCLAPSQSQRHCVLQPMVARNELPWVGGPLNLNPERVPPKTLNRYQGEGEPRTALEQLEAARV